MHKFLLLIAFVLAGRCGFAQITVDLKNEGGPLKPVWAYFGYDEPNFTYMKDGKKLLSEIAALSPVLCRTSRLCRG